MCMTFSLVLLRLVMKLLSLTVYLYPYHLYPIWRSSRVGTHGKRSERRADNKGTHSLPQATSVICSAIMVASLQVTAHAEDQATGKVLLVRSIQSSVSSNSKSIRNPFSVSSLLLALCRYLCYLVLTACILTGLAPKHQLLLDDSLVSPKLVRICMASKIRERKGKARQGMKDEKKY